MNAELGELLSSYLPKGFLREQERDRMSGTFWYLVGVETVLGTSAFVSSIVARNGGIESMKRVKHLAALAILFLAWADPVAAIVGRRVKGIRPWFMNGKSLEGSLAAWIVGALTTRWFMQVDMWDWRVVKGGCIAAFTEAVTIGDLDDNLVMPILSAILLNIFF